MSKLRVYELARELNIETKVMMAKLKSFGHSINNHQSTLTDQQVADLRKAFGGGSAQTAAGATATTGGGARPKVVVRRRAAPGPEGAEEGADVPTPAAPAADEAPAPARAAAVSAASTASEPAVEAAEPAAPPEETPPAAVVTEPDLPAEVAETSPVTPEPSPAPAMAAAPASPVRPAATTPGLSGGVAARPSAPAGGASAAAAAPSDEGRIARRREVSGATIVRRATQEEREKLESNKSRSAAGRKEDNRGTRVTGMGLLSNRVTAGDSASGPPPAAGAEGDDFFARRGGVPAGVKDRKSAEEEEQAKKRAAAKARRSNSGLTTRALLEQAEDIAGGPEPVEEEAPVVGVAPVVPAPVSRTVYTPIASRNKRDLRRRKDLKKTQITTPRASYRVVEMGEAITVGDLARQLTIKASEIIKKLMSQGVMATINQVIDADTATLIAQEYHFEVRSTVQTVEDILGTKEPVDDSMLLHRPPIVTVMGHVDHGKTSILDTIRSADVAGGEAGGITQHIGAYTVDHNGNKITFLDTPGHEAFSAMRARGAGVTDIVVLVVAADDGVMPQTVEAISHAKAANVPIIVAVNKIDKPNLNFDRIYTELNSHGVQAEEWGGDTQFVKCSALQKVGIDELLDAVLLQAEVLDLKAREEGHAEGSVIEAHLDKGRGPVATVVVQAGTLKVGDHIVAGVHVGRVRAMSDHKGSLHQEAGPSIPVEIIGLSGVPQAGDRFNAVADERTAREVVEHRLEVVRKAQSQKSSAQRLEDLIAKVKSDEVPEVVFIIKADTQGSAEAIQDSILKLSTPKVRNRVVHCAVGGISESDITLAAASGAIIIGFNVRAARGLDDLAGREGVVVQYFSIIYEIVDSVKAIMVGKLPPVVSEVVLGHAEVRKPISVPKVGTIGGSAVLDGKITRSSMCRLIRDQIVIFTGKLGSLRRFKDDVKEVAQGYECGIGIEGYNDLKEGDVIEAYVLEETAATL